MITQEQIERAAINWLYSQETHAKETDPQTAYIAGFNVGIKEMEELQTENARLRELLDECRVVINKAISGVGYIDETLPDQIKDALK